MSLKGRLKKKASKYVSAAKSTAKTIGTGVKSAARTAGGIAKQAISATPVGALMGGGGDLASRASAAKGLIRRKRQGGSGIISTMSSE